MKNDNLAFMAIIHYNYGKLLSQGPTFIKSLSDALQDPKSNREGTKFVNLAGYEVGFTCFSIPLLLRVEFDLPNTEEETEDNVQGDLVLYQRHEDDKGVLELKPFNFVKDLEGKMVNFFKYNARGYMVGYHADESPKGRAFLNDKKTAHFTYFKEAKEFPRYFLDTLESFIAKSGIRVVPV